MRAKPSSSIMERMTAGKFRHLPVVDRGRLVGIVSIGDIVKHRVHEMEREFGRDARLHHDRLSTPTCSHSGWRRGARQSPLRPHRKRACARPFGR